MNQFLLGAACAVIGAAAGAGVARADVWLASVEELEAGRGRLPAYGPPVLCAAVLGCLGAAYAADPVRLVLASVFAIVLVQVIFFDLEHALILDRVVFPAIAFALVVSLFRQPWWAGLLTAALTSGAFLLLGLIGSFLARTEALGLGDVKLAGCIALFLGPLPTLEAMVIAFGAAGAAAVAIAVWRRSLGGRIALGPYLAVGALIALFMRS